MKSTTTKIKLSFFSGLREIVLREIEKIPELNVVKKKQSSVYVDFMKDFNKLKCLRSVLRVHLTRQDSRFNPRYIARHKSILGDMINMVIEYSESQFKTFALLCAGSCSVEARSIACYVQKTYKLIEAEKADMKIHIIKTDDVWEIGVEITPRPLSVRSYKVRNMGGAMDPTIAFAVNSLCDLEINNTYLNIFSGSATLLLEAALAYPGLKCLIGFDNNKANLSLAIQNIKKANLAKKIKLKEADIFDKPNFGNFAAITANLPFGMLISKYEDLDSLYQCFAEYCEKILNHNGILGVYTSQKEIFCRIISKSRFRIIEKLDLTISTSVGSYLFPSIFICKLKNDFQVPPILAR